MARALEEAQVVQVFGRSPPQRSAADDEHDGVDLAKKNDSIVGLGRCRYSDRGNTIHYRKCKATRNPADVLYLIIK